MRVDGSIPVFSRILAAVVCPDQPTASEQLAAREVRRYVYLRTGKLLPIVSSDAKAPAGPTIVIGAKGCPAVTALLADAKLKAEVEGLAPQQFLLRTVENGDRTVLLVAGGDSLSRISQRYYGSASRWPDIYNANRDKIGADGVLRVGVELRIP